MFNEKNRKRFKREMFNEQEKNIIIMALMYFKNDYTPEDAEELGFDLSAMDEEIQHELEAITQGLIEDLIGPTWDEETTAVNVAEMQERMTHDLKDHINQLKLFNEPEE
jgi:hypothetical protein